MTQAVLVGAGQWQLYSSIATMSTRKQTQAKDLPRETRWWEGKLGKEEVQFQEQAVPNGLVWKTPAPASCVPVQF